MSFDFFWPKPPTGAIQHRSHVTLYTHVTFSLVNIEKSRLEYVWKEAWVLFTKMFKNPAKEVYWNDMYMCRLISTMYIFFYLFFFCRCCLFVLVHLLVMFLPEFTKVSAMDNKHLVVLSREKITLHHWKNFCFYTFFSVR